jgi:hypothetical protein
VASPHPPPPRLLRPVPPHEHATTPRTATPSTDLVPTRRVVLTPASAITLEPTFWLWDERIPAGAITIGPGREGIGKSLFCAWLTAQITTGALPGVHHGQARSVIYAATEDSWSRTIAGRLHVAGADLDRVFRIEVSSVSGSAVPLSLPTDCDRLAAQIPAHDVALLVIDPLISAVDSRIDVNGEKLREALEPLAGLADDTGVAIFGLAHFNKGSGTDALSRVTGSRAFTAVARAAVAFARDTNTDDGSCVISQIKNNLGRLDVPSLRYHVEPVTLDTATGPGQWGRLVMLGETDTHVEALLNDTGLEPGRADAKAARAWLLEHLAEQGGRALHADVLDAADHAGYSAEKIKHAKKWLTHRHQVESQKVGPVWWWHLPDVDPSQNPEHEGNKAETGQESDPRGQTT